MAPVMESPISDASSVLKGMAWCQCLVRIADAGLVLGVLHYGSQCGVGQHEIIAVQVTVSPLILKQGPSE